MFFVFWCVNNCSWWRILAEFKLGLVIKVVISALVSQAEKLKLLYFQRRHYLVDVLKLGQSGNFIIFLILIFFFDCALMTFSYFLNLWRFVNLVRILAFDVGQLQRLFLLFLHDYLNDFLSLRLYMASMILIVRQWDQNHLCTAWIILLDGIWSQSLILDECGLLLWLLDQVNLLS
tara:strand:+ start:894 stop:1421 length:528 start_codon:yes stop_codon:yes gene_type:complete